MMKRVRLRHRAPRQKCAADIPSEVDVEEVGEEGSLCKTSYDGDDVDCALRDIARGDS
jgi:hypothetical protein